MSTGVEFVSCYIEGTKYPRATCHRHHLTPQHAGGSDDPSNLVWLSANSHQLVHRAAQMVKSRRLGSAQDLAMAAYNSPAQRKRFLSVVQSEVKASTEVAQGLREGKKETVVEVPIPRDAYMRLKLKVADQNAGRKQGTRVSIASYVSRLVQSHVCK